MLLSVQGMTRAEIPTAGNFRTRRKYGNRFTLNETCFILGVYKRVITNVNKSMYYNGRYNIFLSTLVFSVLAPVT